MLKVTGIVGSPRKNGNTKILVEKVLEGARRRTCGAGFSVKQKSSWTGCSH
ncbi:iron-sulfur flavoprotein [Thermotoga neapolitana DSM 4359]|uniref:NAD(P)H-dependent oxidoreductase n=1 Tax=Thermotoga sp. RQ7 TaxID=126738 RepID=UPI000318AD17|nr:NAD(P)H-dependent oxidoreductase [Thermotoga sp. RQ7]